MSNEKLLILRTTPELFKKKSYLSELESVLEKNYIEICTKHPDLRITAFISLKEALTNIYQHSKKSDVIAKTTVWINKDELYAVILDNGEIWDYEKAKYYSSHIFYKNGSGGGLHLISKYTNKWGVRRVENYNKWNFWFKKKLSAEDT